ncbi:MAG TPA: NAD synthetase, partial [Rhodospirillales bacterium]|nr:NAD synthetase [Rhodospirillales bacterium]
MSDDLKGFFYLVSAVCFILALRGLSSPESARKGNILGVTGMLIAAGVTLLDPSILSFELIISGVLIGGAIGTFIALRIQMTALPQLVACFHSLVGLAAVFVAVAAFFEPELYGIGTKGDIKVASLIEMSLATVIGAVTFSGSIVAFAKLQELVKGAPITFKGQHSINGVLGVLLLVLVFWLVISNNEQIFWAVVVLSLLIGFLIIIPIGGADMPVVVSMLNSYSG